MCMVTFGAISRVGSTNACGVARVVCQEPPSIHDAEGDLDALVLTDHRKEGGVAQVALANNTVVSMTGLGVILSTSETPPIIENQHPMI